VILGAAALGALNPVAAATLHNGATIGILLNALRGNGKVQELVCDPLPSLFSGEDDFFPRTRK
jgi:hypothetical protein